MAFNCVQSFEIFHDACFVEIPLLTPRSDMNLRQVDLRNECSKIFHSFRDTEKHTKKQITEDNPLGIIPSQLGGNVRASASIDWVLIMMKDHMVLAQCKGLRNVPTVQVEFRQVRKINFSSDLTQSTTLTRFITSSMCHPGKFDDIFSLTALNENCTNLFKCTVELPPTRQAPRLG